MNIAVTIEKDGEKTMREGHLVGGSRSRERRCIVTGEVRDETQLIRFVVSPDGEVVPDVAAKLPGRGIWVSADRKALEQAIAKNLFSKAAKANVKVSAGLADLVGKQIVQRMIGDLGMARRSGALVTGFDNVARALDGKPAPGLLIEASDGAADGRRKLLGIAKARGLDLPILDSLSSAELSLALGKENVIHAALKAGA
ncbi:MAG TPA: RNA-binding protein, partial [Rhizomicrobium sp.]|nr:RNA-binding protein [Rhizomicrobium sp.]